MTIGKATELIKQLEKENLNNSQSDLDFNLQWIELLKKSISEAIKKKFSTEPKPIFNNLRNAKIF